MVGEAAAAGLVALDPVGLALTIGLGASLANGLALGLTYEAGKLAYHNLPFDKDKAAERDVQRH